MNIDLEMLNRSFNKSPSHDLSDKSRSCDSSVVSHCRRWKPWPAQYSQAEAQKTQEAQEETPWHPRGPGASAHHGPSASPAAAAQDQAWGPDAGDQEVRRAAITQQTVWPKQAAPLTLLYVPVFSDSVPTCTVHPGVARPPSPLMIIHNDTDDDEDDDDEDDDDEEPSVPLEQYRAWLGKL